MCGTRSEDDCLPYYEMGTLLGEGSFGKVYAGTRKSDQKSVAIKEFQIAEHGWHETHFLRRLQHVNGVIQYVDHCFNANGGFILIMERPEFSTDLFEYINLFDFLKEEVARKIFRQVVQITLDCHKAGVIHRDIKCENILVNMEDFTVKMIDFGLSDVYVKDAYYYNHGTPLVCSCPEYVKEGKYNGEEGTVWTLGILLYQMVCGIAPFADYEEIRSAKIHYLKPLTVQCKDLISKCLSLSKRPSLEEILEHPWLN